MIYFLGAMSYSFDFLASSFVIMRRKLKLELIIMKKACKGDQLRLKSDGIEIALHYFLYQNTIYLSLSISF